MKVLSGLLTIWKVFFFSSFWISRWQIYKKPVCSGWFHTSRKFFGSGGILEWWRGRWAWLIVIKNDRKSKSGLGLIGSLAAALTGSLITAIVALTARQSDWYLVCFPCIICSGSRSANLNCVDVFLAGQTDVSTSSSTRFDSSGLDWLVWQSVNAGCLPVFDAGGESTAAGVGSDVGIKASGVGSGVESWLSLSYFLSSCEAGAVFYEDSSDRDSKLKARISSQSSY